MRLTKTIRCSPAMVRAIFISVIAAVSLFSGEVIAGVVLDQSNFPITPGPAGTSNGSTFGRAQTFTVGIAGILDSVDVAFTSALGSAGSLRILATDSSGVPVGGSGGSTVLATAAASSATSLGSNVYNFDLSAANLSLQIGEILAIEPYQLFANWASGSAYSGGNDNYWHSGCIGTPPNQTCFTTDNWTALPFQDAFRTYVRVPDVPEPATLALLALGLTGIGVNRRKKA